jgi:hypothetical protein
VVNKLAFAYWKHFTFLELINRMETNKLGTEKQRNEIEEF